MLIIRKAQLHALAEQNIKDLHADIVAMVLRRFPAVCEELGRDVTHALISASIQACREHGEVSRIGITQAIESLFQVSRLAELGVARALRMLVGELQARQLCSRLETIADLVPP